jgi:type VI secretion system protein ImpA
VGGSSVNLEELLGATAEQPPCGPNLEYDEAFYEIERAATRTEPQEFGDQKTEAQEAKWPIALDLAKVFLGRSKDLRVAIYLARALVQTGGIGGSAPGLALIHELLSRYWEGLHPALEEDGDPTMRLSALTALTSLEAFLSDLRGADVVNSGSQVHLKVRDIEIALGRIPPAKGVAAQRLDQIQAQLAAALADANGTREALGQALVSLAATHKLLVEKLGHERAPDFKPLSDLLTSVKKVCDDVAGTVGGGEADSDAAADGTGVTPPVSLSGQIRSREDAIRLLDRVCEYLERHEPASPAPLLIRRAQRLMTKSFLDIVKDLLPDSVSKVETLAGKE